MKFQVLFFVHSKRRSRGRATEVLCLFVKDPPYTLHKTKVKHWAETGWRNTDILEFQKVSPFPYELRERILQDRFQLFVEESSEFLKKNKQKKQNRFHLKMHEKQKTTAWKTWLRQQTNHAIFAKCLKFNTSALTTKTKKTWRLDSVPSWWKKGPYFSTCRLLVFDKLPFQYDTIIKPEPFLRQ